MKFARYYGPTSFSKGLKIVFPIETIFSDENFKNSDVIICGHSLGGAIASIVTLRLQLEKVLILKCFLGYVGANVLNLLLVVNRTTQTYQIIGST